MTTLSDYTDELDALIASELGEPLVFTRAGRAPKTIDAHVFYADAVSDIGAGQMIDQDIEVHFLKSDIPDKPASTDRIELLRWPGRWFRPTNPSTDDSGTHWIVRLKAVI